MSLMANLALHLIRPEGLDPNQGAEMEKLVKHETLFCSLCRAFKPLIQKSENTNTNSDENDILNTRFSLWSQTFVISGLIT